MRRWVCLVFGHKRGSANYIVRFITNPMYRIRKCDRCGDLYEVDR